MSATQSSERRDDRETSARPIKRRGLTLAAAWAAVLATRHEEDDATGPGRGKPAVRGTSRRNDRVQRGAAVHRRSSRTASVSSTVAVFTGLAQPGIGARRASQAGRESSVSFRRCGAASMAYQTRQRDAVVLASLEMTAPARPASLGRSGMHRQWAPALVFRERAAAASASEGSSPPSSSSNAIAVYGLNNSSYAGPGPGAGGFGVYGLSARATVSSAPRLPQAARAVVGATNGVAGAYAGAFYGPVIIGGDFTVFGAKSAAVPHPDGSHRLLYCVESPESWFEDFGKGHARVRTRRSGARSRLRRHRRSVRLSRVPDRLRHGLCAARQGAGGDRIQRSGDRAAALATGKKDGDLTGKFSWRVVAKRRTSPAHGWRR